MNRIPLIILTGVSLFFSTSVLAGKGGQQSGYNKHGGQGGSQRHYQGRPQGHSRGYRYNKRHHGRYNQHRGYSVNAGYYPPPHAYYPQPHAYYPPPPIYYPPSVGISLGYVGHGTAFQYSSYPHGGFSIGYSHR